MQLQFWLFLWIAFASYKIQFWEKNSLSLSIDLSIWYVNSYSLGKKSELWVNMMKKLFSL